MGSSGLPEHARLFAGRFSALACLILCVCAAGLLTGCASVDRLPGVPLAKAAEADPFDIPYIRFYPDGDPAPMIAFAQSYAERTQRAEATSRRTPKTTVSFLAISGGADAGAYGAGYLTGWSARGDRPKFDVVTGTSTGALIAPFVFLGPQYDDNLRRVFTRTSAADIYVQRNALAAFREDALVDTTPLRELIASYLTPEMVRAIAGEYLKGRLLLVGTTNLDQARSVIWNIGAIAASRHPNARDLIIDILRASASVPGAFPPVMLDVTIDGHRYQEMHVDGGTVAQSFLYPPSIQLAKLEPAAAAPLKRQAFVIRNSRLFREEGDVPRQMLPIAAQAIQTMIASNGVNDLYRIYATTRRDGVDFNLTYIDDKFKTPYTGPFDTAYMSKLFDYGYRKAVARVPWSKTPPGFVP